MNHLFEYHDRMKIIALILLGIGLILRYTIGRRRFNRRGVAGLQQFKSYAAAQITVFIEGTVNIIGMLMIIGAILIYMLR